MNGNLEKFIYSILIFTFLIFAFGSFQFDIIDNYGVATSANISVLNRTSEINEYLEDAQSEADNSSLDITQYIPLAGVYEGIRNFFGITDLISDLIVDIFSDFGELPPWASTIIIMMITSVILFAVYAAILRWRP